MEKLNNEVSSMENLNWQTALETHLIASFKASQFAKLSQGTQHQTITQIINGVDYLKNRRISIISGTLVNDFDISNPHRCILAKSVGSDFYTARNTLGLSAIEVVAFGYIHNGITSFSSDDTTVHWSWRDIFNFLWRATGIFFNEHPEFGVS